MNIFGPGTPGTDAVICPVRRWYEMALEHLAFVPLGHVAVGLPALQLGCCQGTYMKASAVHALTSSDTLFHVCLVVQLGCGMVHPAMEAAIRRLEPGGSARVRCSSFWVCAHAMG